MNRQKSRGSLSGLFLATGFFAVSAIPGLANRAIASGTKLVPPPDVKVSYMSIDMAKPLYDAGQLQFIDVRGDHPFQAEHISKAMSFSLVALRDGKMPPLPKDFMILTYCGCPHAMAEEGARYLTAAGFTNVHVLDEGFYEWKERGWPIDGNAVKSGSLQRMTIRGWLTASMSGDRLYARHLATDQWEAGVVGADGSFELHLPFYGVRAGEPVAVLTQHLSTSIPFDPGADVTVAFD